jgi:hypothetical protein
VAEAISGTLVAGERYFNDEISLGVLLRRKEFNGTNFIGKGCQNFA